MNLKAIILLVVSWIGSSHAFAQSPSSSWKKYVFVEDGFSVVLPQDPKPHADARIPDMTVYTVHWDQGLISLRVSHKARDCAATLLQLKEGALQGKSNIDPTSVTDVSIDGHPGIEYKYRKYGMDQLASDRFYCVDGKFYSFATGWPAGHPFPKEALRIIESFQLVKATAPR